MSVPPYPHRLMRRTYAGAQGFWREYSPRGRALARKRSFTDDVLNTLGRGGTQRFAGTVLVDGMWDNPNYWLRYSLLRAALGLSRGNEIGLLGPFRARRCRDTFARFGITSIQSFPDIPVPDDVTAIARNLVSATRNAGDILHWSLPEDVHPSIIYDGILKRQRLASVDVRRPDFESHVREAVAAIMRARWLLDKCRPDLVVVSHPFNFAWGSLAWQALARGVPVVLPFGLFGVLRYVRFADAADLFSPHDRPTRVEVDALPRAVAEAMVSVGRDYVAGRFGGGADDLASVYAFRRNRDRVDRQALCRRFGWTEDKPVVAVYASNWFDWPHQLGMTQFRDFLDWTEATFAAAVANTSCNWLFKPHPAEVWFGGVALADILSGMGPAEHVAISESGWNNTDVMQTVDALVTYHGTAGVEFAALGKPVLVPDRGRYDDCGFVVRAESRRHYLELLSREWWVGLDREDMRRRAQMFAGWWFCAPAWQGRFILQDDSRQDALYDVIPELVAANRSNIDREIETIREWWRSEHRYYHTSKMARADTFQLTNVS